MYNVARFQSKKPVKFFTARLGYFFNLLFIRHNIEEKDLFLFFDDKKSSFDSDNGFA